MSDLLWFSGIGWDEDLPEPYTIVGNPRPGEPQWSWVAVFAGIALLMIAVIWGVAYIVEAADQAEARKRAIEAACAGK